MKTGQIYFIECAGRIKIGFSKNVQNRLRQFSTGSALKFDLLGAMNGTKELERAIHLHLVEHRAHGEWFDDCQAVREVMNNLLTFGPSYINFIEPDARQDVPTEIIPSNCRAEPSVMHPIIVRIEACAERYLGAGSPFDLSARVERTSEGFSLIYDAVTAAEQLIGAHRNIEEAIPEAAAIASRLERDIEALFSSARSHPF